MSENTKKENLKKAEQLLRDAGFELHVDGCGCCGSPSVFLAFEGVTLIDDDSVYIDTTRNYDKQD